ncbi:MAG: DUF1223 domain-containing protein [Alphaproteobacteria bacterium]|nr:DUF1223 domain-containing protein [Alphaproteobacteria bacterium]
MTPIRFALSGLALAAFVGLHAHAAAGDKPVTVIELFTSQSCYSCPPAEAYLGELAGDTSIVALEYHVDYWDKLNYGRHGRWKDIWSSPEMTARQRDYNAELRDTRGVYTPQMVIDGRSEAVGSRRRAVSNLIDKARNDGAPRVAVTARTREDGGIDIDLPAAAGTTANVWLVTFVREHTTKVLRGENHGKTLTNHNIVRDVRKVGSWNGAAGAISVKDLALEDGQGCAVLVQDGEVGPVLGATYCPAGAGGAAS